MKASELITIKVAALVEAGLPPVEALRAVCGAAVVDAMIDSLYTELRGHRG